MSSHRLQVVYTDDARSELADILLYTEMEWGAQQRDRYTALIRDTIAALAESPTLGRPREELSAGLRSYPVGSLMLYYWATDDTLVIAHIFHFRRDTSRNAWRMQPPPES
jgi:toxin ParE1/3/4